LRLFALLPKILSKTLNFLFPETCYTCKHPLRVEEALFCESCLERLPRVRSFCRRCGTPLSEDLLNHFEEATFDYCGKCLKDPPPFERAYPGFHYTEPIKGLIHRAKFREDFVLAYKLGRLLRRGLALPLETYDLILPLPLSKKRERERGYNQSLLILWGYLGFRLPQNLLTRVLHTKPQTELAYKERLKNPKGAFWASQEVSGKRVLLLDDVMTTGATLREAAHTLKKQGAREVHLLVLARA